MEFNIRLKECRNERGWTQEGISKMLSIKRPRYAKYETGENEPDYATLIKLADLFGVSTDYLLGRDEDGLDNQSNDATYLLFALNNHLKDLEINVKDIIDIRKWRFLNQKDIEEIKNHIDWIAYKAQKRISK